MEMRIAAGRGTFGGHLPDKVKIKGCITWSHGLILTAMLPTGHCHNIKSLCGGFDAALATGAVAT